MIGYILQLQLLNNSVLDYIICLVVFLSCVIGIKIFKYIFVKKLKAWFKKSVTFFYDFIVSLIEKLVVPFLYLSSAYISIRSLTLDAYLAKIVGYLVLAVLMVFAVRLVLQLINFIFVFYLKRSADNQSLEQSLSGALKVIKFIIWSLAFIFFLDNLGFKISAVIAGLGIGGVAIALAAQAILKDLFSYFSILFDRPFEVGDFIIVGDLLGTVEHVGIKTTRIRSLGGEELIFSNSDLTDSRLRNYKRMEKRRVVFKIGVVYDTPLEQLKAIPKIIENAISKVKDTVFDRAHFFSYGDFSLIFEVVYYVLSRDYNKYMDIQQEINFIMKEEFEKQAISFAFPTQTVHLAK